MWKIFVGSLLFVSSAVAQVTPPGLTGRTGATKDKLIAESGGNRDSEAAVARGLAWLARQQQEDGSWKSDGKSTDTVAATSLAVLPFLVAGETHKTKTSKYNAVVTKAMLFLTKKHNRDGSFLDADGRGHALATFVLCDALVMTSDPILKAHAEAAVAWLVKGQAKNGSWGLNLGEAGDIPMTYWAIQALATAKMAQVKFDKDTAFKAAEKFLESQMDKDSKFGDAKAKDLNTATAQGLYCRYLMGNFVPKHPAYARGIDFLKQSPPKADNFDIDYFYAATPVFFATDGPDWHKFWNPKVRDLLIEKQQKGGDEKVRGSWEKAPSVTGEQFGTLGTTCLSVLTLEVYYRYLPLYKRDTGGLVELEK